MKDVDLKAHECVVAFWGGRAVLVCRLKPDTLAHRGLANASTLSGSIWSPMRTTRWPALALQATLPASVAE